MKQYTQKEFIKIVKSNGFYYNRHNGDHAIYVNDKGRHISIPKNLECVIALRLIKENDLNTNIKELKRCKRMGILSDNLPVGAENDPMAPWNEPPDINHKRFVSLTISFYTKVKGPEDMSDESVEEIIRENIKNGDIPKGFDIDELVVLED